MTKISIATAKAMNDLSNNLTVSALVPNYVEYDKSMTKETALKNKYVLEGICSHCQHRNAWEFKHLQMAIFVNQISNASKGKLSYRQVEVSALGESPIPFLSSNNLIDVGGECL